VQYFMNRGEDDLALKLAGFGLKSMIADPHLALFTQFVKLKRLAPREARKLAAKAGFRSVDAALRDLDRRLSELEESEPLRARHKMWVKSLRKVRVVPDEEWRENIARIAAANPLKASRRAERERAQAELQVRDPLYGSVRALCDMAGVRFTSLNVLGVEPMRVLWPEGPNRRGFCVEAETDKGPRHALFFVDGGVFKTRRAVLIQAGQALPQADLTLTGGDYAEIVPAHIRLS
jgi:hypothetical protein